MKIFALKVGARYREAVHASLLEGEGRYGWSYAGNADLKRLRNVIQALGWQALNEDEQNCYQNFLLDISAGDYVVYINLPEWGRCTLACVTEGYFWERNDDDFNHRFKVDPESVITFDRNDAAVDRALSARLKLQGRWWRIYAEDEFRRLLDRIERGETGKKSTPEIKLRALAEELRPTFITMTKAIQHTHPNYDLEHLLELLLTASPAVKEVDRRGGAGDQGADLVVIAEQAHPITGHLEQKTYVIQVKSFVGTHADSKAAHDIGRAFEKYRDAAEGIIVSTAERASEEFEAAVDRVRQESGRPVHLILGEEVAGFVVRLGWELLQSDEAVRADANGVNST